MSLLRQGSERHGTRHEVFYNVFDGLYLVDWYRIMFEVEEDSAILGLVDINYGVAVVPNIPMIDHFHLKKLKIKNPQKKRIIYMATVKNRYVPPAVHSFCNFIVQNSNID